VYRAAAFAIALAAMADDFPPGPGTSGVVTTDGTPVAGVFDFPGDVDAFTVQLPANGRAFAVLLENTCHNKTVELYDAGFRLLRAPLIAARPDQDHVIEWRAGYTGLYYVVIKDLPQPEGYICPVAGSDSYTVSVGESCAPWIGTRCTMDDADHKFGTLRGVEDRNWYKFHVAPNPDGSRSKRVFLLSAYFRQKDWVAPFATLRAANGGWLTDDKQLNRYSCAPGDYGVCAIVSLCPGTYFLAVRDDGITQPTRYSAGVYDWGPEQPGTCPR
jgi:hypothetical protein